MKILIVEDDFTSRKLMQFYLQPYGESDVAVDGEEAVEAVAQAFDEKDPYDVIFLDIMMPRMNGQEVLKKVREMEKENGILGLDGAKIIMTTALNDSDNIIEAFRSQCEGYLPKPVDRAKMTDLLVSLGLLDRD